MTAFFSGTPPTMSGLQLSPVLNLLHARRVTGDAFISVEIGASQTDWEPSGLSDALVISVTQDGGPFDIRSLDGGDVKVAKVILNDDPDENLTLKHEYTSGTTPEMRFNLGGSDVVIAPGYGACLVYDTNGERWNCAAVAVPYPLANDPGAPGDDGLPGLNWRGAWIPSPSTTYAENDGVSNNGRSYICLVQHSSASDNEPGAGIYTGNYWDLLADKGADGLGTGDVVGPASSVAHKLAAFADTSGKLLEDSGVAVSTDGALASNSDAKIPTEKAVKAYADSIVAAQDAMVFKGVQDCSGNPNYPDADRGHTYRTSVAGKIGGASGVAVEVGDIFMCLTDGTSSGNQASVGTNWTVIQTNIDGAVVGPASATDGRPALFDGTTGKLLKQASGALGDAAFKNTGTTTGTLSAGDDSRITGAVQAARQVLTATGLAGGGDLSADRTIALAISALTEDTTPDAAADFVLTYDTSATSHKKVKLNKLGGGGGAVIDVQKFASSGTWTKPSGLSANAFLLVYLLGGGGGAGRSNGAAAGGGGGGGILALLQAADVGSTESMTIGAGGAGRTSSSGSGTSGGDTSFGSGRVAAGGGTGGYEHTSEPKGGLGLYPSGSGGWVDGGTDVPPGSSFLGGGGGGSTKSTLRTAGLSFVASAGADAVTGTPATPGIGGGGGASSQNNTNGGDGGDGYAVVITFDGGA